MLRTILQRQVATDATIGRALIGLMAIGFAALTLAIGGAVWVTARNQQFSGWVSHTYEVEVALERFRGMNEQAEAARRGYMLMPFESSLIANYRQAADRVAPDLGAIARLTADNAAQRPRVAAVRQMLATLVAQREQGIKLTQKGQVRQAIALYQAQSFARTMRRIRATLAKMDAEERRLLGERAEALRGNFTLFYTLLSIAGALLLLVAGITFLTLRRYTRDLAASRNTLRRLNESLEEAVVERTADLSRANEEIQRFAYIVSHDLRSPLVNVMGFTAELEAATRALAELIDRTEQLAPDAVTEEARTAAREDLPEAIGFIRTSTAKMDRLINAILQLSREGRRVLAPEPLDVAAVVEGIRGSMQHRIDETGVEVAIERPLPGLVSDRLAIEQILSNLIENAVKYLQPGRPGRIVVRGRRDGARVHLEVEDNGRGIDPKDHQRVFDLFRRSGAQDQPGEGIGLAHVRALAYRLGGVIDVRSELGTGATFRLNLPTNLELRDEAA